MSTQKRSYESAEQFRLALIAAIEAGLKAGGDSTDWWDEKFAPAIDMLDEVDAEWKFAGWYETVEHLRRNCRLGDAHFGYVLGMLNGGNFEEDAFCRDSELNTFITEEHAIKNMHELIVWRRKNDPENLPGVYAVQDEYTGRVVWQLWRGMEIVSR